MQPPNQNPFPFAGMNMPPLGPEQMDKMKRELKRRFAFFGLGLVVFIVALFLDPKANGWPEYTPTLVMLGGGAVAFMGLLGLSRGAGCMAQIAAFFWLLGMACNVGSDNPRVHYALAGGALIFAVLALFLPKKQNNPFGLAGQGGAGGPMGFPFGGFGGQGGGGGAEPSGKKLPTKPKAKDRIIEVDAQEKD
ncbi:MAG: hypothetical protein R3B09_19795 [Nannocystaceae bacterium]